MTPPVEHDSTTLHIQDASSEADNTRSRPADETTQLTATPTATTTRANLQTMCESKIGLALIFTWIMACVVLVYLGFEPIIKEKDETKIYLLLIGLFGLIAPFTLNKGDTTEQNPAPSPSGYGTLMQDYDSDSDSDSVHDDQTDNCISRTFSWFCGF